VTELSFSRDLYAESAVGAALEVYSGHGRLGLRRTDAAWVVELEANSGVDEVLLADELANYVLGATIERRGE
jgi:hypothetical protein